MPCSPSTGTWMSIITVGVFMVGSVLSCLAPKPVPAFHRLRVYAQNDEHDPCCYLCTKAPPAGEDAEEDEEAAEEETDEDVDATENGKVVVAGTVNGKVDKTEKDNGKVDKAGKDDAKTAKGGIGALTVVEEAAMGEDEKGEMATGENAHLPSGEGEDLVAAAGVRKPKTYVLHVWSCVVTMVNLGVFSFANEIDCNGSCWNPRSQTKRDYFTA